MKKDNYYILIRKKSGEGYKFKKIEGRPVKNIYGLDLFFHIPLRYYKLWRVSEGITGCKFTKDYRFKKECLKEVYSIISVTTSKTIKRMIAKQARIYGISPRWRKQNKK